jgi:phosphoglycolate phosphatase-like HAD superfamily hydrolase
VTGRFPAVICHEDVVQKKPHAEGVEKAMAILGTRADDCCFVGDTPEDIQMGKSAQVYTVAVVSEYVGRARLEHCGPDVLLESIAELPEVVFGRGADDPKPSPAPPANSF